MVARLCDFVPLYPLLRLCLSEESHAATGHQPPRPGPSRANSPGVSMKSSFKSASKTLNFRHKNRRPFGRAKSHGKKKKLTNG
jgi:hypothetical protein